MIRRVFLIVLDSVGAGEAPDATDFGDAGANTLRSVSTSDQFKADTMLAMGLGNIDGLSFLGTADRPTAAVARLTERSRGKDTTIGHWEIAGLVSDQPMPTFPEGFPGEVIDAFKKVTGRGVLCNRPYSGTEVIADYGCDPGDISTDHTREYTPLIVYGVGIRPVNMGTRGTFADIGATVAEWFRVPLDTRGESFAEEITK